MRMKEYSIMKSLICFLLNKNDDLFKEYNLIVVRDSRRRIYLNPIWDVVLDTKEHADSVPGSERR